MKRIFNGNIFFFALLVLSGLLLLIFLNKESWLDKNRMILNYMQTHIIQRSQLSSIIQIPANSLCQQHQTETVSTEHYHLHCTKRSIFVHPKPTKEKYIAVEDIRAFLDIDTYDKQIYRIHSLSDLPESSAENPKVVIVLNDIDETLKKDFYGIIITDYHFDIKGKKIFGALYSSYNNQREERHLTYRRNVIDNIEKHYAHWFYLPHSKRYAITTTH